MRVVTTDGCFPRVSDDEVGSVFELPGQEVRPSSYARTLEKFIVLAIFLAPDESYPGPATVSATPQMLQDGTDRYDYIWEVEASSGASIVLMGHTAGTFGGVNEANGNHLGVALLLKIDALYTPASTSEPTALTTGSSSTSSASTITAVVSSTVAAIIVLGACALLLCRRRVRASRVRQKSGTDKASATAHHDSTSRGDVVQDTDHRDDGTDVTRHVDAPHVNEGKQHQEPWVHTTGLGMQVGTHLQGAPEQEVTAVNARSRENRRDGSDSPPPGWRKQLARHEADAMEQATAAEAALWRGPGTGQLPQAQAKVAGATMEHDASPDSIHGESQQGSAVWREGPSVGVIPAVLEAAQELAASSNIPGISVAATLVSMLARMISDYRNNPTKGEEGLRWCRSTLVLLRRAEEVLGKVRRHPRRTKGGTFIGLPSELAS